MCSSDLWELMMQQYEDEDEDENEEVGILTRFHGLLLSLGLQLYHRLSKLRERLDRDVTTLGNAADKVREIVFRRGLRAF